MKTRIISAAVIISIVFAVLFTGYVYTPWAVVAFVALLAAASSYEMLNNIVKIGTVFRKVIACVYAVAAFLIISDILGDAYGILVKEDEADMRRVAFGLSALLLATVAYAVAFTLSVIIKNREFDLKEIFALLGIPFMYSAAFSCLNCIITGGGGIYYLLLVINFSSICDTGAYFVGVTMGKHKLCEHVSPKKTVEGAVGGVVASLIITLVLMWAFGKLSSFYDAALMLGVTVVMCIVGMLGDLFASIIKRSVGVKDYSNLIPGHGGILDRFDSMLFISPAIFALMLLGVVG